MPAHKKRYCSKGHDTHVVGRYRGSLCKECSRIKTAKRDRDHQVAISRKYRHGVDQETFTNMLVEQNGICAICLHPEIVIRNGKVQNLSIDHCHKTGQIRSLLCASCNVALGCIKDNPQTARALAAYLEKWQQRNG